MERKICTKCKEAKRIDEFYWKIKGKAKDSECKQCRKKYNKKWYANNKDWYLDKNYKNRYGTIERKRKRKNVVETHYAGPHSCLHKIYKAFLNKTQQNLFCSVSGYGIGYSYMNKTQKERQSHLDLETTCIDKKGRSSHTSVYCRGLMAHLLNTLIFVGHKIHICHACHNSKCSNPKHLYWGWASENRKDRVFYEKIGGVA